MRIIKIAVTDSVGKPKRRKEPETRLEDYGLHHKVERDAECWECGTRIPVAVRRDDGRILCRRCWEPELSSVALSTGMHFDDDNEATGSWDNAVARWEDSSL